MPIERIIFPGDDAPGLVLIQTEDIPGSKPNRENRLSDNGSRYALETAAIDRKLGFQDGVLMIQNRSAPGGNGPKRVCSPGGRHVAEPDETLTHTLDPERRVRIEHDVLGACIPEQREHLLAKFSPELHVEPITTLVLFHRFTVLPEFKTLTVSVHARTNGHGFAVLNSNSVRYHLHHESSFPH
jgi:hypothetical protein